MVNTRPALTIAKEKASQWLSGQCTAIHLVERPARITYTYFCRLCGRGLFLRLLRRGHLRRAWYCVCGVEHRPFRIVATSTYNCLHES